ncbi:MAG: DUF3047 domain-containing protein [Burkholderiales bacterium]
MAARRLALLALPLAVLGGCATAPGGGTLLASTPIVHRLDRETADVVEVARFSRLQAGADLPEGWMPWGMGAGRQPTRYRIGRVGDDVALEANADRAGTGLNRDIRVDPHRQSILEWRWRVDSLTPDADMHYARQDDSAARLVVAFHGDPAKLDFDDRAKLRIAKALIGEALPYAILMYVWANDVPVGTVIPSPHFSRIKLIVVESGPAHLGQWVGYRRNVLEDYRRAFGEDPGDIVSVGVLTDSDSPGHVAHDYYGDISLSLSTSTR